ncbi:MAG TPA: ABC transporter permease [Bryobacteraceae bacterium]|nr:ABC transporter permease [Bryobacteraceae bacterium]
MALWSRIRNVFRGDRLNREFDEELEGHLADAIADGSDPAEARRALGPALHHREASRDARLIASLDSLRADIVFGLRQLRKSPATSAAAILSLALAMGACISAFRLVDALLLRPLPVSEPDRLFVAVREGLSPEGQPRTADSFSYPLFRQMRAAVKGQAELIAVSRGVRTDITYGSDNEMEKAYRQYVSGHLFQTLGLRPAVGRLFSEQEDQKPGGHPYAVVSHQYWQRRLAGDPGVIGRTLRMGNDVYEIVGVCGEGFTGTEPGTFVDIFVPVMMNAGSVVSVHSWWIRTFVRPEPGVSPEVLQAQMNSVYRTMEQERSKSFTHMPRHLLEGFPRDSVVVQPAASGMSAMKREYLLSLTALAVLVGLVLLIACTNIANLMTARASARAREMALRVSIGAGRFRLVQLVLAESAWIALIAAALGCMFASWSAPYVVSLINPPDDPARLHLPFDWRLTGFSLVLAFSTTFLFGLVPALRASGVKPASALKGGEDPHARRRLMQALISVQVAFCLVVLMIGGLFIATWDRLARQQLGYSAERLLALETVTKQPQSPVYWSQVAAHLRTVPGVESVAYSEWPLMSGEMWNNFISINGAPPGDVLTFLLPVSPGWVQTMKVALIAGRDFRPGDVQPGAAIVNETFARQYFNGENPVGKWFSVPKEKSEADRYQIVGLTRDARYDSMRRPIPPVAYLAYDALEKRGAVRPKARAAFMVRTTGDDPTALAATLRREVARARPEFRVSNIRTQREIDESHTVRERLLATLALFFAVTALLLAGIGLYGVLDYSVIHRRREIGIRMAIGASAQNVAGRVTADALAMVLVGMVAGVAVGVAAERYIRTLLFGVRATDSAMLAGPVLIITGVAVIAMLPAIVRALRTNPAMLLRTE